MADKRISQLVERTDIANNDVVPIVASGATTTNKATISSIQEFMQENLDLGVTSVGITLGTIGNDVSVSGSPITTSGNITINIPSASSTARGLVNTIAQTFSGEKTFANGFSLLPAGGTNQVSRFLNIGSIHQGIEGLNQIGFNNSNNIYFGKGLDNGGVIQWTNAAVRYYTLPDADGTIALTSQLDGYVTLGTAQTITAQKTFTTSGSSDTMIISHGSGSGFALDVIKAGNSEAIRVTKTSGSGNAMTVIGGNFEAPTIVKTGGTSSQFLKADGSVDSSTYLTTSTAASTYVTIATPTTITGVKTFSGNTLQLQADGTSQATIFRNSSGQQTNTVGSNSFGFNNSNNIYFNKGSLTNAGILVFNNTAARAYTLPDATGTLALTTDLGAYLPLAGGTLTGALNGTSAAFNGSVVTEGLVVDGANNANISQFAMTRTDSSWGIFNSTDLQFVNSLSNTTTPTNLRFVITAAGNVGIGTAVGVAPAQLLHLETTLAGSSGVGTALQITSGGAGGDQAWIGVNKGTGNGLEFSVENRDIIFNTAATSPFGGTEQMRITSGGNVGIACSPEVPFEVHAGRTTNPPALGAKGGTMALLYNDSANGSYGLLVGLAGANVYLQNQRTDGDATAYNLLLQPNGGNVGIGTDSPGFRLDVSSNVAEVMRLRGGAGGGSNNNTQLRFYGANAGTDLWAIGTEVSTGGTDRNFDFYDLVAGQNRLRITSGGNLLIANAGQTDGALIVGRNGNNNSILAVSDANNTSEAYFRGYSTSVSDSRIVIFSNGNIVNSNNSYGALSDIKIKENITDATPKLEDLLKVKVRNYNLIGEDTKQIGVIAQELEEVFPAMIDESEDFEEVDVPQLDEEGNEVLNEEGEVVTTKQRVSKGTTTKSVKYSVFVPMLIKAIQELKTEIDSLKNQIK
jgi:hypothetical protein